MSKKLKYLKKEDLKSFDKFIQETLDKYIDVKPWEDLYKNTGDNHKDIISDKSTIPDLVIFNKRFNKLNCFYYENNKRQYVKFPRKHFKLKPKSVKEYNPSLSYVIYDSKKEEEEKEKEEGKRRKRNRRKKKQEKKKQDGIKDEEKKDEEKEEEKNFEFKSIPKEIENQYIVNNNLNNNEIFNELNDFMNSGNDNKIKIEIIKNNGKNDMNEKDKEKNPYDGNNKKNKFFKSKFDSYDDYFDKFIQNLQFQSLMLQKNKSNNTYINNINKKFGNISLETKSLSDISRKNNNDNNSGEKTCHFLLKYHSNGPNNQKQEETYFNNYLKDLENFMKENLTERIWIVINEKIKFVHKYNSEELYYLLNNNVKNGEINNYSIYSIFNHNIFISPFELLEILKELFKKEQEK